MFVSGATVTKNHKPGDLEKQKLLPPSSGCPKSKIRPRESHAPSGGSQRGSPLASSSFWWPQAPLGLWAHHSSLCPIFTQPVFSPSLSCFI